MKVAEYQRLLKERDEVQKEIHKAEGRKQQLLDDLEKIGYGSPEEARQGLRGLKIERERIEQELEELIQKLEESIPPKVGEE